MDFDLLTKYAYNTGIMLVLYSVHFLSPLK